MVLGINGLKYPTNRISSAFLVFFLLLQTNARGESTAPDLLDEPIAFIIISRGASEG